MTEDDIRAAAQVRQARAIVKAYKGGRLSATGAAGEFDDALRRVKSLVSSDHELHRTILRMRPSNWKP